VDVEPIMSTMEQELLHSTLAGRVVPKLVCEVSDASCFALIESIDGCLRS
jgi:hypothetical protein